MAKLKKNFQNRSLRLAKNFSKHVQEELHVKPNEHWAYREFWEEMPFKQYRSVGRCALLFAEIAQAHEDGNPDLAWALACQSLKACHQFALDGGSWKAAWSLTFQKDPYVQAQWGGSEAELATIANHLKAENELKEKLKQVPRKWNQKTGDPEDQQEEGEAPKGKGKGK